MIMNQYESTFCCWDFLEAIPDYLPGQCNVWSTLQQYWIAVDNAQLYR